MRKEGKKQPKREALDAESKEALQLPGEMTDIRYVLESIKFVGQRIDDLKAQKEQLKKQMKQQQDQINNTIESAEAGKKHLLSILKKVKKAGG